MAIKTTGVCHSSSVYYSKKTPHQSMYICMYISTYVLGSFVCSYASFMPPEDIMRFLFLSKMLLYEMWYHCQELMDWILTQSCCIWCCPPHWCFIPGASFCGIYTNLNLVVVGVKCNSIFPFSSESLVNRELEWFSIVPSGFRQLHYRTIC